MFSQSNFYFQFNRWPKMWHILRLAAAQQLLRINAAQCDHVCISPGEPLCTISHWHATTSNDAAILGAFSHSIDNDVTIAKSHKRQCWGFFKANWIQRKLWLHRPGMYKLTKIRVVFHIQSTPDNSNLQVKYKKGRVIGSSSYRR